MNKVKTEHGTSYQIQRGEVGEIEYSDHSNSQGKDRELRHSTEPVSVGLSGTPSSERVLQRLILGTGGIISRLVKECEDRIQYTDECIEWYQREKDRELEKLEELRRLAKDFNE